MVKDFHGNRWNKKVSIYMIFFLIFPTSFAYEIYQLPICNNHYYVRVFTDETYTLNPNCEISDELWKIYKCDCSDTLVKLDITEGTYDIQIQYFIGNSNNDDNRRTVNLEKTFGKEPFRLNIPTTNILLGVVFFVVVGLGALLIFLIKMFMSGKVEKTIEKKDIISPNDKAQTLKDKMNQTIQDYDNERKKRNDEKRY